jgi:hypothetical protein
MRVVIRSSSLLFSILGIILHVPVAKVKKKKVENEEPPAPPVKEQSGAEE